MQVWICNKHANHSNAVAHYGDQKHAKDVPKTYNNIARSKVLFLNPHYRQYYRKLVLLDGGTRHKNSTFSAGNGEVKVAALFPLLTFFHWPKPLAKKLKTNFLGSSSLELKKANPLSKWSLSL